MSKTFEIIVTRTTFEECNIEVEASTLTKAKEKAIAECEADDEGGQNFDWQISSGTECQAKEAGEDDADDGTTTASRVRKIETLIAAGKYEADRAVCDILTDLRHYCDAHGFDFALEDKHAYDHYSAEVSIAKRSGKS